MKRLVCDHCGASDTVPDEAENVCPMCGERMELLYQTDPQQELRLAVRDLYRGLEDLLRATLSSPDAEAHQVDAQYLLDRYAKYADEEDDDGSEIPGGDEVELSGGGSGDGQDDRDGAAGEDEQ